VRDIENERAIRLLEQWQRIGIEVRLNELKRLRRHLDAFRWMSAAGSAYATQRARHLEHLVESCSERFAPVGDPLAVGFGLNRWLSECREEAYSDWLAWVLQELGSAKLVSYLLFGWATETLNSGWAEHYIVDREVWVPEGHRGHAGRLDCVLRFGDDAVVVLELKKAEAESADTAKHEGYLKWLNNQPQPVKKAVLIASATNDVQAYGGFDLLRWKDLCRRARYLIPVLLEEKRLQLSFVSVFCAFIGAVEQNFLRLPAVGTLGNSRHLTEQDLEYVVEYLETVRSGVADERFSA